MHVGSCERATCGVIKMCFTEHGRVSDNRVFGLFFFPQAQTLTDTSGFK